MFKHWRCSVRSYFGGHYLTQGHAVHHRASGSNQWPSYHWSERSATTWATASQVGIQSKTIQNCWFIAKYSTKCCIISPNLQSVYIWLQQIRIYYISRCSALQRSGIYVESTKSALRQEGRASTRLYGSILKHHVLMAIIVHFKVTQPLWCAPLRSASVSYFTGREPSDTCMLITVSGAAEWNWSLSDSLSRALRNCISIWYPLTWEKGGNLTRGWGCGCGCGWQFWFFKQAKLLAAISTSGAIRPSFTGWRVMTLSELEALQEGGPQSKHLQRYQSSYNNKVPCWRRLNPCCMRGGSGRGRVVSPLFPDQWLCPQLPWLLLLLPCPPFPGHIRPDRGKRPLPLCPEHFSRRGHLDGGDPSAEVWGFRFTQLYNAGWTRSQKGAWGVVDLSVHVRTACINVLWESTAIPSDGVL